MAYDIFKKCLALFIFLYTTNIYSKTVYHMDQQSCPNEFPIFSTSKEKNNHFDFNSHEYNNQYIYTSAEIKNGRL